MPGGDNPSPLNVSAPEDEQWTILVELAEIAEKDEGRLRQILRPHDEAEFIWTLDAPVIRLRERLDRALNMLTLLEIEYQIGRLTSVKSSDPAQQKIPFHTIPEVKSLVTLADSE